MVVFAFPLQIGNTLFGEIWSKNEGCQIKPKLGTQNNQNLQNSVATFTLCFRLEIPFLVKFGPKSQNCQFKLKFGSQSNSNMQNSMMPFTFFVFDQKYSFLGKFVPKNQNCQFKLKFGTQANWNMQNSMVMSFFLFSIGNTFQGKIWSIKSELSVQVEILYILLGLAKILGSDWSFSPSSFYRQLPDNQSHFLALCTQQMSSFVCF